jgi:branched-chain amino acid transport system substrate-binding protein
MISLITRESKRLAQLILSLFFISSIILPAASEDLRIPVLVGQTGASELFGRFETEGYTMAVEEWNAKGGVNGKPVVLSVEDTQTSSKQILSAFHRHAQRGVPVILGPTWLDGFPAVIPVARKRGVLLVTPSAAVEAFSAADKQWPVSFYHNSTTEIKTLRDELKKRNLKRVALFYEHEPFSEMIRRLLLSEDFPVVADIGTQSGESDFRTPLTKLRKSGIDAIVVFVWNQRSLLALLQQIRMILPPVPLATVHDGEGWLENPDFKPLIDRLIFTRFVIEGTGFEQRFKSRFGHAPLLTASNAYDAMNAVLAAFSKGADSAESFRNYLTNNTLDTVTFGSFAFSKDGRVPSRVEIVEHRSDN